MDIKQSSADIHLNPAAGFEELMELLSLISACVGGLSFLSPNSSTAPDIEAYSVVVCRITHTCGGGTDASTDALFVSHGHKTEKVNKKLIKLLITPTKLQHYEEDAPTHTHSGFKVETGLWGTL